MSPRLATLTMIGFAALPAFAQGGPPDEVRGQVVEVREHVATASAGAATEIRVRTRDQESVWLRLGTPESMHGKFQVGDRVRARYVKGDGAALVTDVRNGSTGERLRLRDRDCTSVDGPDRLRTRDRIHEPGTGGGNGGGGRQGGNGNRGSGGGSPRHR
jgi:uncharacterized membrane protein YgcG